MGEAAADFTITVDGIEYGFTDAEVDTVIFDGGAAADTAVLNGSNKNDRAVLWPDTVTLSDNRYSNQVASFRYVHDYGTPAGDDVALLQDDPLGIDTFVGGPDQATLSGGAFSVQVNSFRYVHAYATAGSGDVATLHDAVLETGVTQPVGMTQVAWLYEFERIRQRSDEGETVINVVDQIFTAYWP